MKSASQQLFAYTPQDLVTLYASYGLGPKAAASQAQLLQKCLNVMHQRPNGNAESPVTVFFVPGRIEVLGKHTDYAGGRSLVCAVDHGFCFVVRPCDGQLIKITNAASGEHLTIPLDNPAESSPVTWENYPLTVVRRVCLNFGQHLQGAEIVFDSDLPAASGMSSSSALMIGFFLCLSATSNLPDTEEYRLNISGPESLAMYLACIENGQSFGTLTGEKGVGTFGGSEDHIAILCGRHDSLVQYRYAPVVHERTIPMPGEFVFAVAYSGVRANKIEKETLEKYNRMSLLTRHLAGMWTKSTGRAEPHLWAILQSHEQALPRLKKIINDCGNNGFTRVDLRDRLQHFVLENEEIVPAAGNALARQDLTAFQRLVGRSQELAETLLKNQVPETIFLTRSARQLGAQAASCFGAGFGGSVWAMVGAEQAEDFVANWRQTYLESYAHHAEASRFLTCKAGPSAFQLFNGINTK